MEKEIKITPPDGYEIDKENSTFDCIKFKPITQRWRDSVLETVTGWYFSEYCGQIVKTDDQLKNIPPNYNIFATEKHAKSALAMAQISQIMAHDKRFGGVVTDEEWENATKKFVLVRRDAKIENGVTLTVYDFLAFHTAEQRDLFLRENEDLVRDYLML